MKKLISILSTLAFFFTTFACSESLEDKQQLFKALHKEQTIKKSEVSYELVKVFAEALLTNSQDSIIVKSKTKGYTITPVVYQQKTVFWLVNYDCGYLLLSADKNKYPIIQYSSESIIDLDDFFDPENKLYQLLITHYEALTSTNYKTKNETGSGTNQIFDIWEDIEETIKDSIQGVEYTVEVSFETFETQSPETKSPNGSGTITNREYKRNYSSVYPSIWQRSWDIYSPYNWSHPTKPYMVANKVIRHPVSKPALALALIMDHYKIPDATFWKRQPNIQTEEKETELTKFLYQLGLDLGYRILPSSAEHLDSDRISKIPAVLNSKYGFAYTSCITYHADQAGFDQVRLHLQNYGPVWYVVGSLNHLSYVIDGVMELYTKVTIKKKFLGIKYKTVYKYYYCDYFHFVNPSKRQDDNWQLYDYDIIKERSYVYLLKKK